MSYLRILSCIAVLGVCSTPAVATITPSLSLGSNGGLLGTDTLNISQMFTDNGVNFTANFTLMGSGNLFDGNGIGVVGNGSNNLDSGETLTLSFDSITNVSGGTANFDGFTALTFEDLATGGGEVAQINPTQFITANGETALSNAPISGPITITALAGDFRLSAFRASFDGAAAVPEPSSMIALAFIGTGLLVRRRRRD